MHLTRRGFAGLAALTTLSRLRRVPELFAQTVHPPVTEPGVCGQRCPQALLNQTFVTLDAETVAAIETSPLLHEAAAVKQSSGSAIDKGKKHVWKGRYVYLRETFLEIFAPGDALDDAPNLGSFGLIFGTDVPGTYRDIDRRLADAHVPHRSWLQKQGTAADAPDWFYAVEKTGLPSPGDHAGADASASFMEYVASYFERPGHPPKPSLGPADTISRRRYNEGAYKTDSLLEALTSATYAVAPDMYRAGLRPMLSACGFEISETAAEATCKGKDIDFTLLFAAPEKTGLREWRFRTSRALPAARSEVIGNSRLSVGPGNRAAWSFA